MYSYVTRVYSYATPMYSYVTRIPLVCYSFVLVCTRMLFVEKPDPPVFSYEFQRILNASVFSELAMHTETKMIIFTSGPPQGLSLFFLVNFGYSW